MREIRWYLLPVSECEKAKELPSDEDIEIWANSLDFTVYDNFWDVAIKSAKAMRDGKIKIN
jgi:hypothetical protein